MQLKKWLTVSQRLIKSRSETKIWTLSISSFASCLTGPAYRIVSNELSKDVEPFLLNKYSIWLWIVLLNSFCICTIQIKKLYTGQDNKILDLLFCLFRFRMFGKELTMSWIKLTKVQTLQKVNRALSHTKTCQTKGRGFCYPARCIVMLAVCETSWGPFISCWLSLLTSGTKGCRTLSIVTMPISKIHLKHVKDKPRTLL